MRLSRKVGKRQAIWPMMAAFLLIGGCGSEGNYEVAGKLKDSEVPISGYLGKMMMGFDKERKAFTRNYCVKWVRPDGTDSGGENGSGIPGGEFKTGWVLGGHVKQQLTYRKDMSFEERLTGLSGGVSVGVDFPSVRIDGKAEIAQKNSRAAYKEVHSILWTSHGLTLSPQEGGHLELTEFGRAIADPAFPRDVKLKDCGNEYISQIDLAASFMADMSIEFENEMLKARFAGALSVDINGNQIQVKGDLSKFSERELDTITIRIQAVQIGGDPSRLTRILPGDELIQCRADKDEQGHVGRGMSKCIEAFKNLIHYAKNLSVDDDSTGEHQFNWQGKGFVPVLFHSTSYPSNMEFGSPRLDGYQYQQLVRQRSEMLKKYFATEAHIDRTDFLNQTFELDMFYVEKLADLREKAIKMNGERASALDRCFESPTVSCIETETSLGILKKAETDAQQYKYDEKLLDQIPLTFYNWCQTFNERAKIAEDLHNRGQSFIQSFTGSMMTMQQLLTLSGVPASTSDGNKTYNCLDVETKLHELSSYKFAGEVGNLRPLISLQSSVIELDLSDKNLGHTEELYAVGSLKKLRKLNLSNAKAVSLVNLKNLPNLREILAKGAKLDDVEPIKHISGIRRLDVSKTYIDDFSPLAGHKTLAYLDLTDLTDVTNLRASDFLRFFNKEDTDHYLPNLRQLNISLKNFADQSSPDVERLCNLENSAGIRLVICSE